MTWASRISCSVSESPRHCNFQIRLLTHAKEPSLQNPWIRNSAVHRFPPSRSMGILTAAYSRSNLDRYLVPGHCTVFLLVEGLKDPLNVLRRDADAWTVGRGYLWASGKRGINGNFRILKWRYVSTICLAIFCWDIPWNLGLKNRPYIW